MSGSKRDTAEAGRTNGNSGLESVVRPHTRFRALKTCLLVLTWAGMGMRSAMVSTTLPDQRMRLNATTSQISNAIAIGAVGGIVGAPLGALADRFGEYADLIMCGLLTLAAILHALRGLIVHLPVYTLCFFLEALVFGSLPPMGNSVMLAIWGAHNTRAIQALHMGMPIGQVIGPLIAIPFVSDKQSQSSAPLENTTNTSSYSHSDSHIPVLTFSEDGADTQGYDHRFPDNSQIEIALWIVSAYLLIIALLFVVMECKKTDDVKKKVNVVSNRWRDIVRPSYWAEGSSKFGLLFFSLLALFFILHIACQLGVVTYITVYAVDSGLGFTNQQGALLNSLFHLSGVLARLVTIALLGRVSNLTLMWALVHGELLGAVLYAAWGASSKVGLWVSTAVFGALHRPIWGACYAWANDYMILMAGVIAALNVAHNVASVPLISLYGYLYDATVIQSVFYMCSLYAGLACLAWYLLYYVGRRHGTRSERAVKREAAQPQCAASEEEEETEAVANGAAGAPDKHEAQIQCEWDVRIEVVGSGAAVGCAGADGQASASGEEEHNHDNGGTKL